MKVYVVFIDWGSWDDHRKYISRIFSKEEAALAYAKKTQKETLAKQELIPKEPDDSGDNWEEEYEKYRRAYGDAAASMEGFYDILEFNFCVVEEFEVYKQ